jgi:hypothetical protein
MYEENYQINLKKEWLDYLFYKIGNQNYNFELQILNKDGKSSKRKRYSQVCFDYENNWNRWFIGKCNQRQVLPIEVVLDFEDKNKLQPCVQDLKKRGMPYYAYSTGSRGHHIHLFFKQELNEEQKLRIIRLYGADEQLASAKHMIALEFAPHWKSGKIKELIKEGENGN